MNADRSSSVTRMTSAQGSTEAQGYQRRFGPLDVLVLSAWCGLIAGLLEVATRIACRAIDPTGRLYLISRHYLWLIPLANMLALLGLGLFLAGITRLWPRRGWWLSGRLLGALVILPSLMVAGPQVFTAAWFVLALGIASRLVPWFERTSTDPRRFLLRSLPVGLAVVVILAGTVFAGDWLKQRREAARALPPADCPNVLLIVLDTVRADRLSLYGYNLATTPILERLAQRGVRFHEARATAPWTLPSHASIFTGRWPHELAVKWMTPLGGNAPTLAEYLEAHGCATAGFVGNVIYCSSETGLDRGFTHYEDYYVVGLGFLRLPIIVDSFLTTLARFDFNDEGGPSFSLRDFLRRWFYAGHRRDAATINRAFLRWLDRRPEPGRPFFVFLNYIDAHVPYKLPDGATPRFGPTPESQDEIRIVYDDWASSDKLWLPRYYVRMARDCYDNCLAYLDEQLGALCDELQRRGVLEHTLILILSDHGEGLGEHDLFDHGLSLYSTEIRVPLLILPPGNNLPARDVRRTVSLRDIPATVVDLVGLGADSPFPGRSLAQLWRDSPAGAVPSDAESVVLSELPAPTPNDFGRSPARRGPMLSLAEGDFVYIRNQGDGTEELFNERDDPRELTNRARVDALKPVLERFRDLGALINLKDGRRDR